MRRLRPDQVDKLIDSIRATLEARCDLIAASDGKLTIKTYPRGGGFDVKLTVTTR